jgi:hypothetical protein
MASWPVSVPVPSSETGLRRMDATCHMDLQAATLMADGMSTLFLLVTTEKSQDEECNSSSQICQNVKV